MSLKLIKTVILIEGFLIEELIFSFAVVTIYATLGDDALIYGLNESEANVIVTDASLIQKLKNLFDQLHFIDTVIYFGEAKKTSLLGFPNEVKFHSMSEVEELGSRPENSKLHVVHRS